MVPTEDLRPSDRVKEAVFDISPEDYRLKMY